MNTSVEIALAHEAAAHARAALELNPFGEAEALEIGGARAVYTGQWSPVHGVFGLGCEGVVEDRDIREIERFFFHKERTPAFWIAPETDPSLLERLGRDYQPTRKVPIHGASLPGNLELPPPSGSSREIDHRNWCLALTQALDPFAKEPGLFALTKLHQKDTRYYLSPSGASYTYFHAGIALIPVPGPHSVLALQASDAVEFKCMTIATSGSSPLPFLYERTLYERL